MTINQANIILFYKYFLGQTLLAVYLSALFKLIPLISFISILSKLVICRRGNILIEIET